MLAAIFSEFGHVSIPSSIEGHLLQILDNFISFSVSSIPGVWMMVNNSSRSFMFFSRTRLRWPFGIVLVASSTIRDWKYIFRLSSTHCKLEVFIPATFAGTRSPRSGKKSLVPTGSDKRSSHGVCGIGAKVTTVSSSDSFLAGKEIATSLGARVFVCIEGLSDVFDFSDMAVIRS